MRYKYLWIQKFKGFVMKKWKLMLSRLHDLKFFMEMSTRFFLGKLRKMHETHFAFI